MTAIACWLNKEEQIPRLWAIGDTRISQSSQYSQSILSDEGCKIFQLPIICKGPGEFGFNRIYFTGSIGFCFAGSTFIGLNLYSMLASILSNLASSNNDIPSIKNISELSARISIKYLERIGYKSSLEFCILGYCNKNEKYGIFYIHRKSTDNYDLLIEEIDLNNEYLLLGSHKNEIKVLIDTERENCIDNKLIYNRVPKIIIEKLIKDEIYPDIGGSLQIGISDPVGFNLYLYCKPLTEGKPEATLQLRNIDIFQEIGLIGDCFLNINGMV